MGRVTGTTKYSTPIVLSALPANPQVANIAAALAGQDGGFYDNFSEGLGGYTTVTGSGSGIAVVNGRLTLTNQTSGNGAILVSNRIHTISATATQAFHYEITPTTFGR